MPIQDYSYANLAESDLSGANFAIANLKGANFGFADLRNANFSSSDLTSANFSGANLANCDFSNAKLSGTELNGANLTGAKFSGAELTNVKLRGALLTGIDVSKMDLSTTDLRDSDLDGANLTGAKLPKSGLRGADLRYSTLSDIDFKNIDVTNVIFSDSWVDLSGAVIQDSENASDSILPRFEPKNGENWPFQFSNLIAKDKSYFKMVHKIPGSDDIIIFTRKSKTIIQGNGIFTLSSDGKIDKYDICSSMLIFSISEFPKSLTNRKKIQLKIKTSKMDENRNSNMKSQKCKNSFNSEQPAKRPKIEKLPDPEVEKLTPKVSFDENNDIQQALMMSNSEFVSFLN